MKYVLADSKILYGVIKRVIISGVILQSNPYFPLVLFFFSRLVGFVIIKGTLGKYEGEANYLPYFILKVAIDSMFDGCEVHGPVETTARVMAGRLRWYLILKSIN